MSDPLSLFLSYASEDRSIADALATCLSASFGDRIDLKRMSKFPLGASWREQINENLDRADVLIAIASGRLKPGHSFTGYEIGAFHFSCRKSSNMAAYPNISRISIPFAVLSGVPDTLSEFQGVGIDPQSIFAVKYDAGDGVASVRDEKIFAFLLYIENLITKAEGRMPDWDTQAARRETLRDHSRRLFADIKQAVSTREEKTERPKSKLIIRMDAGSNGADLSSAKIWVAGDNCLSAFGIEAASGEPIDTSSAPPMNWKEFTANVKGDDISAGWKTVLEKLMSSAIDGQFIDDRLTSFNRKKTLRVFISKVVRFFNKAREFHVYVVDLLPATEYGDPETTLLQNALKVGLTYRSMFLEDTSQFSPAQMMATDPTQLPEKVSRMTCELEYLLQFSRDSRLDQAGNILTILGPAAAPRVGGMFEVWNTARERLLASAKKIATLTAGNALLREFLGELTEFCVSTKPLNDEYLAATLRNLHSKIAQNAKTPVPPRDGYAATPTRDRTVDGRRRNGRSAPVSRQDGSWQPEPVSVPRR
jgi:hypothetical protein